jgi:predicted DNA-binding transcriptional regulator AlpA
MTARLADKPVLKRGLSRHEAAQYVGIGTTLFDQLVEKGILPPCRKLAGRTLWDLRQVDRAMDELFEFSADPFAAYGRDDV